MSLGLTLAVLGAAIATIAGVGSAIGVGIAGEAADGVMSGDKVSFGSTLVLQALPGTQGIYGMVIAILILTKIGILGGNLVKCFYNTGTCIPVCWSSNRSCRYRFWIYTG